jgi:integrase
MGGIIMPRKIKNADLINRTSRDKLAIRGRPHYHRIDANLSIGYRRLRGRSGTWTARIYIGNGEYAFEPIGTADDRSDADGIGIFDHDQAVAKARELHTKHKKTAAGIRDPLTVEQAVEAYAVHLSGNGKRHDALEATARKYILPLIGKMEVDKLTSEALTEWKAKIAKMPARGRRAFNPVARKASANRTITMLKTALKLAYDNGKVESDKAWRSLKKFDGVERRRDRFLSLSESKRLINAADSEFRPMIQAALATGCRYAELCNLKVSDFHTDSNTLFIRTSKAGKSRSAYLTEEGVRLFGALAAGRRGSEPLIRRDDGLPFGPSHQIRRMVETCKNARIEPISFHGLRHSYASALVKAGTPLAYVAESLGHANIKMVSKHYGHIEKSHLAETIRANVPKYGFAKSNVRTLKHRA